MKNMMGNIDGEADRGQTNPNYEALCDAQMAYGILVNEKRLLTMKYNMRIVLPTTYLKKMNKMNAELKAIEAEISSLGGGR